MRASILPLTILLAAGCALGDGRRDDGGGDAPRDAAPGDAGERARDGGGMDGGSDAGGPRDGGPPGLDAGRIDGGRPDAGAPDAGPGGALDPRLGLPDPSGATCTEPGLRGDCPGTTVCRFYTPTEGRCESCGPCGNLNTACTSSAECDILFMCFGGRCTNFCTLGSFECGAVADCLDVGHPTRGVCRPF